MTHYSEYDTLNKRYLLSRVCLDNGELLSEQKFDYFENGLVEHYKNPAQRYVRTITNEIKDALKIRTEKFVCETNPSVNYTHEVIHDLSGKLVQFICNGEKLFKGK